MSDSKIPPEILAQMIADAVWLKADFFRHFAVFTAREVANLSGQSLDEAERVLDTWRAARKVLSITRDGIEVFPSFQFGGDGQPLPVVGQVLELFSKVPSRVDWDNAIWFVAANGWLGGRMPYELLTNAPQKVKHAAEQEVLPDIE